MSSHLLQKVFFLLHLLLSQRLCRVNLLLFLCLCLLRVREVRVQHGLGAGRGGAGEGHALHTQGDLLHVVRQGSGESVAGLR